MAYTTHFFDFANPELSVLTDHRWPVKQAEISPMTFTRRY